MPDVVRPCVLSKGGDVMPCPMLPIVCAVQGWLCHAMPDVVQACVPSKGGDAMPSLTSFHRVCYPRGVMSCHARRRPIMRAVVGW